METAGVRMRVMGMGQRMVGRLEGCGNLYLEPRVAFPRRVGWEEEKKTMKQRRGVFLRGLVG
jgi:hypothetical protein